jgi:hypothetical protein
MIGSLSTHAVNRSHSIVRTQRSASLRLSHATKQDASRHPLRCVLCVRSVGGVFTVLVGTPATEDSISSRSGWAPLEIQRGEVASLQRQPICGRDNQFDQRTQRQAQRARGSCQARAQHGDRGGELLRTGPSSPGAMRLMDAFLSVVLRSCSQPVSRQQWLQYSVLTDSWAHFQNCHCSL